MTLEPIWTWRQRNAPERAYDHARLLPNYIVGAWFSLDRQTGKLIWESTADRPNTIFEIWENTIIATESVGWIASTFNTGIYGIDLLTGAIRWTNHDPGEWNSEPADGEVRRGAEALECDCPMYRTPGCIITSKRRLLDTNTGRDLGTVKSDRIRDIRESQFSDETFFRYGVHNVPGTGYLFLGTGEDYLCVIEHVLQSSSRRSDPNAPLSGFSKALTMGCGESFGFTMESEEGKVLWDFDLPVDRFWCDGNYHSYRECAHWLFFIYAEPESDPQDWDTYSEDTPNFAPFYLAALDLRTGKIAASIQLTNKPVNCAEIEAIDSKSLLVSVDIPPDRIFIHIPLTR